MSAQPPRVGEYLRSGPVQRRLLDKMATGHAFIRHGDELGITPTAHRTAVRAHLAAADLGFEVTGRDGKPQYLVGDLRANRVAWVNPHLEHRSTFFAPYDDVFTYARRAQAKNPDARWRTIDVRAERARAPSAHRIMSASRGGPDRSGPAR